MRPVFVLVALLAAVGAAHSAVAEPSAQNGAGTAESIAKLADEVMAKPTPAAAGAIFRASPEQVLGIRKAQAERTMAIETPFPDARIEATSEPITLYALKDGKPPVISLLKDNPSIIEFVDITGAPWEVAVVKAYCDQVSAELVPTAHKNALIASSQNLSGVCHMAVFLKDMPEGLTLRMEVGNGTYHSRRVIKLESLASTTQVNFQNMEVLQTAGKGHDEDLMSLVYGVAPHGYSPLDSSHPEVQAWSNGKTYALKTRLNLLSPQQVVPQANGDYGVKGYKIQPTSRITLLSDTGSVVNVQLSDTPLSVANATFKSRSN